MKSLHQYYVACCNAWDVRSCIQLDPTWPELLLRVELRHLLELEAVGGVRITL
jgi:hypothetical protein